MSEEPTIETDVYQNVWDEVQDIDDPDAYTFIEEVDDVPIDLELGTAEISDGHIDPDDDYVEGTTKEWVWPDQKGEPNETTT